MGISSLFLNVKISSKAEPRHPIEIYLAEKI